MKPPRNPAESSPSTLEWWSCPGVVYFVAAGDSPYLAIKIGVAAQTGSRDLRSTVRRRLDQIQSSNHEPIQLLGLKYFEETAECAFPMREADALERELHNRFQHLARFSRDTRGSEWFTAAPDLLDCIHELATPPEHFGLPRHFCKPIPK